MTGRETGTATGTGKEQEKEQQRRDEFEELKQLILQNKKWQPVFIINYIKLKSEF